MILLAIHFFFAVTVAYLLTFPVRWICLKYGFVARPDVRRRHSGPVPNLGGMGIYFAFFGVLLTYLYSIKDYSNYDGQEFLAVFVSVSMIFALGILDDLVELKPLVKFIGQVLAAMTFVYMDRQFRYFYDAGDMKMLLTLGVSIVWIVGITNAINMIDGMDGLASGITVITLITMSYLFHIGPHASIWSGIALVMAGACVGFLMHNFPPARVFLGDNGSMIMGFILAITTLHTKVNASIYQSIILSSIIMIVPLTDIASVFVMRIFTGKSPFHGDRNHLHFRMARMGIPTRKIILFMYALCIYSGLIASVIKRNGSFMMYLAILGMSAMAGVFMILVMRFLERKLTLHTSLFGSEDIPISEKGDLRKTLGFSNDDYKIVMLNAMVLGKALINENPAKVKKIYSDFYKMLVESIRRTDQLLRISPTEYLIVARKKNKNARLDALVRRLKKKTALLCRDLDLPNADPERAVSIWIVDDEKTVLKKDEIKKIAA